MRLLHKNLIQTTTDAEILKVPLVRDNTFEVICRVSFLRIHFSRLPPLQATMRRRPSQSLVIHAFPSQFRMKLTSPYSLLPFHQLRSRWASRRPQPRPLFDPCQVCRETLLQGERTRVYSTMMRMKTSVPAPKFWRGKSWYHLQSRISTGMRLTTSLEVRYHSRQTSPI